jgi:hypothetical protein
MRSDRVPSELGPTRPCIQLLVAEVCDGLWGVSALRWVCVLATLALTACAPHMIYLRADGVPPASDVVLNQQFEMDRTICQGDLQKANVSGVTLAGGGLVGAVAAANRSVAVSQVGQGCMAEKGYVLVKEEDASSKSQELAAIAAEKARREAEAAAASAAQAPPPKKVAAKPKPKPPQPSPPPATPASQPSAN